MHRRDPVLLEEWVRGGYDTRSNQDLPVIARSNDNGTARSYHVTDAPTRILSLLRRGPASFIVSYGPKGQHAELGPGFYVGNPAVWSGRATRKWTFLDELDEASYGRLSTYLQHEIDRDHRNGRLTDREHTYAGRAIASGDPGFLVGTLANPPYSVSFWKPEILQPLGIMPSNPPSVLAIDFQGRYVELLRSRPPPVVLRLLRRMGYSGVFTRSSMGSNPELVIWERRNIVGARLDET